MKKPDPPVKMDKKVKISSVKVNITPEEKEKLKEQREAWKYGMSRDGKTKIRLPSRMRIAPGKYKPGKGKVVKNKPHCYMAGPLEARCKQCMWRFVCKVFTVQDVLKKEPIVTSFQDSTGDGV